MTFNNKTLKYGLLKKNQWGNKFFNKKKDMLREWET